jgi:two-component system response regulator (stage 0 sporulation protein F)
MSGAGESQTVLVVDDEERLRKGLARSLGQDGRRALAAASGNQALDLLKRERVDLVVTDLVMPGMDGMTLVRNIRETDPSVKVIVITAYGSPSSMQEAEELGVASYMAKPFALSRLKSVVDELLAGRNSRPVGSACPRRHRGLCTVCLAGGNALRSAFGLSRKALSYVRPRNVIVALGKGIGRATAATSGLASAFSRSGPRYGPHDAANKEVKGE